MYPSRLFRPLAASCFFRLLDCFEAALAASLRRCAFPKTKRMMNVDILTLSSGVKIK